MGSESLDKKRADPLPDLVQGRSKSNSDTTCTFCCVWQIKYVCTIYDRIKLTCTRLLGLES